MARRKKPSKVPEPPAPQQQQFLGRQRLTYYACVIVISGLSLYRFFQARVEEILGMYPAYRNAGLEIYILFAFYVFTFGAFFLVQYFCFGDNIFRWDFRQPPTSESEYTLDIVSPSAQTQTDSEKKSAKKSKQPSSRNRRQEKSSQETGMSPKEMRRKIGSSQKKKAYRRCTLL